MLKMRVAGVRRLIAGFGLIGLLLIQLAIPLRATAQGTSQTSGINLTTAGSPISLAVKPGESITTDLRIRNSSTRTERLKATLMKFDALGTDGLPRLLDPEPNDQQFSWVSFDKTQFDAPPNEWVTIKMTIAPPQDASYAYYYAVAIARASEKPVDKDKQLIVGAAAMLILVKIDRPGQNVELKGEQFIVSKNLYEYLPASFEIKIKNVGNVHAVPTGNIFIKRGGSQVGVLSINSEKGNVLPNSERLFNAKWSDGFPVLKPVVEDDKEVKDKKGNTKQKLSWNIGDFTKLRFGKYTAKLVLVYSDENGKDVPVEGTVSFWVFPWKILLVLLIVIVFTFVGAFVTARKVYRRSRRGKG